MIMRVIVKPQSDLMCGLQAEWKSVTLLKVPSLHGAQMVSFVRVAARRNEM